MFSNSMISRAILTITLVVALFCLFVYYFHNPTYHLSVGEDGVLENSTALFLFLSAVLILIRTIRLRKQKKLIWLLASTLLALALIFGAGEEISWGQRIFMVESSDYFLENNKQDETNIHNLEIAGIDMNRLITNILAFGFGMYFLIFPILNRTKENFKQLFSSLAIFLPNTLQIFGFLLCTVVVLLIPHDRKWEVWEFVFALCFFAILLNPINFKEVY